MEVSVIKHDNCIVFQLSGNFDQQGSLYLRNILINEFFISDSVPDEVNHVVFDFSGVESISSSAIGLLASLQRIFNKSQKPMSLIKIPHSLQQILKIANLSSVFKIYNNLDDALKQNK